MSKRIDVNSDKYKLLSAIFKMKIFMSTGLFINSLWGRRPKGIS